MAREVSSIMGALKAVTGGVGIGCGLGDLG